MKATQAFAMLVADEWELVRQRGSHRTLKKGGETRRFSYHDRVELGATQLRILAKKFGLRWPKGVA